MANLIDTIVIIVIVVAFLLCICYIQYIECKWIKIFKNLDSKLDKYESCFPKIEKDLTAIYSRGDIVIYHDTNKSKLFRIHSSRLLHGEIVYSGILLDVIINEDGVEVPVYWTSIINVPIEHIQPINGLNNMSYYKD